MGRKCTIKDLAAELHLSRNTVSKVLSGSDGVSEGTRKLVLEKAREMNYKQTPNKLFSCKQPNQKNGSILFLTRASYNNSDFWIKVLHGINLVLHENNYDLVMYILSADELEYSQFPSSLYDHTVDGIILVDIYNPEICKKIVDFNIPTVFLEMPYQIDQFIGKADFVTMENRTNLKKIVTELVKKGITDIAFAGDISSVSAGAGFHERWDTVRYTMKDLGYMINETHCFLKETDEEFANISNIVMKLRLMDKVPAAYICGNDWVALNLMKAVQKLGYEVPKDILFVGFDDIEAAVKATPSLTTIQTPKEYLGTIAARKLINRINNPSIPFEVSHFSTKIIIRRSTGNFISPEIMLE